MGHLKMIELACLYLSHRLAFIDAEDHRLANTERANDLRKFAYSVRLDHNNRFVKYFMEKQAKMDALWLDKYYQQNKKQIKKIQGKYNYHECRVTCCASCHTGTSSVTRKELQSQRVLFGGIYICKSCSNLANNIDDFSLSNRYFTGKGVYRDEGLHRPGSSMLGFAGAKIMLKKTNGDIVITNSLFEIASLHNVFLERVKHRINCQMFWLRSFEKEDILKFITEKEYLTIGPQLESAEKLGHKI